jgi:hypothetical protein
MRFIDLSRRLWFVIALSFMKLLHVCDPGLKG